MLPAKFQRNCYVSEEIFFLGVFSHLFIHFVFSPGKCPGPLALEESPAAFANPLRSISYGSGKFVAVGDGGVIHASLDGITWDSGQRPTVSLLHKVIFANGRFVAVGENGTIVVSADGNSWTNEVSGTANALYSVTYDHGTYVACGQGGCLVISTNASTWSVGANETGDLGWIAGGNGVFILPSTNGPSWQLKVQVSPDAVSWTTATFPNPDGFTYPHAVFQVEFGNGVFVAAAQDETDQGGGTITFPTPHFYYSIDGTNWTRGASGGIITYFGVAFQFLDFAKDAFYELGLATDLGIGYSTTNGTTSTSLTIPAGMTDTTGLTYGNGRYVASGLNGDLWASIDGQNWTSNSSGIHNDFHQIIGGSNGYVAIADSQPVLTSSDGINFVSITNSPNGMTALAFDGTIYVGLNPNSTQIFTSTNSVVWFARNPNVTKVLLAVCRGANGWVAESEAVGRSQALPIRWRGRREPLAPAITYSGSLMETILMWRSDIPGQ